MPKKPATPSLNRAQKRAYAKAIEDGDARLKLARGDADAILAKAQQDVMETIDRVAARNPATARTTRQAKKGFRRS